MKITQLDDHTRHIKLFAWLPIRASTTYKLLWLQPYYIIQRRVSITDARQELEHWFTIGTFPVSEMIKLLMTGFK